MTDNLLYRFRDGAGVLLYVGITANLPMRLRAHQGRDWWQDVRSMVTEPHPTREAVFAAERVAIETEHPLHNVILNGGVIRRRPRHCAHGFLPDRQGILRCCDCDKRMFP